MTGREEEGSGDAKLVKCSPHKYKDLGSSSTIQGEKLGVKVCVCSIQTEEMETKGMPVAL